MSIENPLGLENLLVNTIAGSAEIFAFLAIIFFSALAGKFHMPKSIFLVLMALFGIIFSGYIGGIYLIIIILTGIVLFNSLGKVFS